ncbi:cytochrome c [Sphingomicrobium flavum]|uniref:cytochrome c n=1 Tax=Sphingomicrobium flavum TaxID=1229164 RepID=UPI0021AD946B|nr:cytochrome c [Sphingomicrobium flavum]
MKKCVALLVSASLCACAQETSKSGEVPVVEEDSLSFDGADYADEAGKLAHGERVASMMGCRGCHGAELQGGQTGVGVTFDAPNLSLLLPDYSEIELEKALRGGVARDGRALWSIMPSAMYSNLSPADYEALVAYVRSFPPGGEAQPAFDPASMKRIASLDVIKKAPAEVMHARESGGPLSLGNATAKGRYIATTSCTECHGAQLEGFEGFSPNLDIAGSIERGKLERLLTDGTGISRPDLGLMSVMGKFRFSQLTEAEREALVDYLLARADANTQ